MPRGKSNKVCMDFARRYELNSTVHELYQHIHLLRQVSVYHEKLFGHRNSQPRGLPFQVGLVMFTQVSP